MTIWVGIDGSASSERALEWAMEFASSRDETITPVSCWSFPAAAMATAAALPPASAMDAATEASTTTIIKRVTGRLCDDNAEMPTVNPPHIVQGQPSEVLRDLSEERGLVVVGNRGRGGFEGLILGSVSSQLAASAESPVVIVPHGWTPGPDARRIVVGVDTAKHSEDAARWAAETFNDHDIELVHAWRRPPVYGVDHVSFDPINFEEAGKATLEKVSAELSVDNPSRISQFTEQGDARAVLLDRAKDASLLVVAAQRYHGVRRLLLGSIAQGVVHHLVCPTAIVPEEVQKQG